MDFELAFTPSGHLIAQPAAAAGGQAARLARAFAASQAEGLFTLANEKLDAGTNPGVTYWRSFAGRYLTELCHTPETAGAQLEPIGPPAPEQLTALVLGVPPMPGAEYLTEAALENVWTDLDAWIRREVARCGEGLAGFLKQRAPLWHQVGRVCFHLAENKRDTDYPFAFLATYAPGIAAGARVQYQPLSRALQQYAGEKNRKALVKLLSPVQRATGSSALVKELVDSGDLFQPLAWTPREAYRFLQDTPRMEESGILIRLPDWWKKRPRPRVGVTIGEKRQKRFGADAMLDFKVQVALGDQPLTDEEWNDLLSAEDGLVLLRGQWVEVDRRKLAEALDQWKAVEAQAADGLSFIEGMRLLAGAPKDLDDEGTADPEQAWSFIGAGEWLGQLLARLRSPEQLEQAAPGADLKATLRPYQAVGVNWLWFLSSLGLGACLADDMGLGKTVQVLGLLTALKRQSTGKPSLLVLPASLLANWKAEMARFTPSLRAVFAHPSETAKHALAQLAADPGAALSKTDVVLTTYGMLLRQPWLSEVDWRLVALDEAQAIKNPASRQTKAVRRLRAEARVVLTGTPVENRLSDLWSLFDFLCPGLLGSQRQFKDFVKRLGARTENRYAPLRGLVQPYILRRLKTDKRVIADLPEKTEVRAFCGLGKRQAALYAKMVQEMARALEDLDGMQRRGLVLAYLMRFKQLCNHPSHLLGDGEFAPDQSGKFERLAEICEEIASRQEKGLVFTQFREMADPLAGFLAGVFGRPGLVLHGGTAVKGRKRLVDQFQADGGPPFFVLSLKAGGTGLNLTAASHVIHFDRWWNPAVENQATDRAFRIGQRRNVLVHKFVCRGTIEERIDALIEEKTALAADLLEGGAEKMLTEMTDAELIKLVALDVEKARV
ncbi:MAG: DEAD/DEAH box helicase [Thermoguttaceae bacterium]|jgi:non-specific serine/threonine protein kinase|nr:DEAD/DEAH box helicase [Thermoguttaceae bacterium]